MTDQLTLIDPEPPRLTERQQVALEHLGSNQPLTNDELGAFLHEARRAGGGSGHGREERCAYCAAEGGQMGRRLRELGYAAYRRGHGWVVAGTPLPPAVARGGYDPAVAPFPKGF